MVDALYAGPEAPRTAAFFDLDRTLLAGFSALALGRDLLLTGRLAPTKLSFDQLRALFRGREGSGFGELMDAVAQMLRGTPEGVLVEIGERQFREEHRSRIFPEARALLEAHFEAGHTVVLATAATSYQALPIARHLGIEHVLSTRLAVSDGRVAGRVERPTGYGTGKFDAIRTFARKHDVDLSLSFAYSDGREDLPMLSGVGHPRAVNPDEALERVARASDWPILHFDSRQPPDLTALLEPLRSHPLRYAFYRTLTHLDTWQQRWSDLARRRTPAYRRLP